MHQAKKDVMNFSNVKLYLYKIFVGFIYNLTDQNWFYGFCKNMEIEVSVLNRENYKNYDNGIKIL